MTGWSSGSVSQQGSTALSKGHVTQLGGNEMAQSPQVERARRARFQAVAGNQSAWTEEDRNHFSITA